jgi:hypothetical protein
MDDTRKTNGDKQAEQRKQGRIKVIRSIKGGARRKTRWVTVNMGGEETELYCDTGSNITIITPQMYKQSMGKIVAAKSRLRAWGSSEFLDTKGMFKTNLTMPSGATKRTWVYVVGGGEARTTARGPRRRGPGSHKLQPTGTGSKTKGGGGEQGPERQRATGRQQH